MINRTGSGVTITKQKKGGVAAFKAKSLWQTHNNPHHTGVCAPPRGAAANAVKLLIQRRGDERRRGPLGQLTPGGGGRAPRLAEVIHVRHGTRVQTQQPP